MPPTDPLRNLGVRMTPRGGELRVWSGNATNMDLVVFDSRDSSWVTAVRPMTKDAHDIWSVSSSKLAAGARYAIRATGPKGKTPPLAPGAPPPPRPGTELVLRRLIDGKERTFADVI